SNLRIKTHKNAWFSRALDKAQNGRRIELFRALFHPLRNTVSTRLSTRVDRDGIRERRLTGARGWSYTKWLCPSAASSGYFCLGEYEHHEADLPAAQSPPETRPRLSRTHVDEERPPRHQCPPQEGAQAPHRLMRRYASLRRRRDFTRLRHRGRRTATAHFTLYRDEAA